MDFDELITTIKAGARGWLVKNEITSETLMRAIDVVMLGGLMLPPCLCWKEKGTESAHVLPGILVNRGHAEVDSSRSSMTVPLQNNFRRLSNREQAILRQLTLGFSNKHIARNLDIAEATVKVHIKQLLRKIEADNRTQAAVWAMKYLSND